MYRIYLVVFHAKMMFWRARPDCVYWDSQMVANCPTQADLDDSVAMYERYKAETVRLVTFSLSERNALHGEVATRSCPPHDSSL